MAAEFLPPEYTILHLPAGGVDWAGILAQFTLFIAARDGRAFASWAGDRLLRATKKNNGFVALVNGDLRGLLLYEIVDQTAELSLPWMKEPNVTLAHDLVAAARQFIRDEWPDVCYIRAERQLMPDSPSPEGLEAAGFFCGWRWRMCADLAFWRQEAALPADYRVTHWQVRHLDAAAEVVYRANRGTLDAILYAPFFGASPAQCRKGLLAILAGRYGPIHPQATLCAFRGEELVGINLVINDGDRLSSIVEISVDPAHQGKGIGRALMIHSMRTLRDEHIDRVELAVTKENRRAHRLYQSLGFTEFGDFPVFVWPRPPHEEEDRS